MSEQRIRREKVLVLRNIYCDNETDSLDGPNPKKFKKGEVIVLPPVLLAHYSRHGCVTRDLPILEDKV
ncbi:MAG TPA: hypothetical protein EYN14_09345 [Alphaproteobacteria bacterium]|nr:hypothetical protein [Alphaproteobacteria bacterium]